MYARDDVIPEPPVTPWEFLRPGETGRAIREPGASDPVAIENDGTKQEGGRWGKKGRWEGGKGKEKRRKRERLNQGTERRKDDTRRQ